LLSQFQSPMLLHLFSFHKKNQSHQHPTPYSSQITPLNFCPHIWSHPSPFLPPQPPFLLLSPPSPSPPSEQVTSRQNKNTPSPSSSSSPAMLPTKPNSSVARALSLSLLVVVVLFFFFFFFCFLFLATSLRPLGDLRAFSLD
jgi:sensor histidine kinase YesM